MDLALFIQLLNTGSQPAIASSLTAIAPSLDGGGGAAVAFSTQEVSE